MTEILAAGGDELPETVRDAVLARIALLGEAARRLLEVVAIVPARAELWLLEAVAPGRARATRRLPRRPACSAPTWTPSRSATSSPVSRSRRHVAPHRRRALHAEILRALVADGAISSRLAHHAEEAGDDDAVLEHARGRRRARVARAAHREAAAQYARALRHAGALPDAERAELLDRVRAARRS